MLKYGRLLYGIGTTGVLLRLLRHVSLRVECIVGHHDVAAAAWCQDGVCTEREATATKDREKDGMRRNVLQVRVCRGER